MSEMQRQSTEILGTKWTALIIRELSSDPKKFSEIERAIPGLNPRTLSKRLDELRICDIVTNCTGDPEFSDTCYRLTKKGSDLLPILEKMSEWDRKYPRPSTWNVA